MTQTYKTFEDLRDALLYKRIIKWDTDELTLDTGETLKIIEVDSECDAHAGGRFNELFIELDAMITDVKLINVRGGFEYDSFTTRAELMIYNNLNPIALAELEEDQGNLSYYYSVVGATLADEIYTLIESDMLDDTMYD